MSHGASAGRILNTGQRTAATVAVTAAAAAVVVSASASSTVAASAAVDWEEGTKQGQCHRGLKSHGPREDKGTHPPYPPPPLLELEN